MTKQDEIETLRKTAEKLGADSLAEIDWEEAEELQSEGQAPSNLFKGIDGKIYFDLCN